MTAAQRLPASNEGETAISRRIRDGLAEAGYWVLRLQAGRARGGKQRLCEPGTPDLLVIGKRVGPLCFLETKKADGELLPSQILWHAKAAARGVRVFVVRSAREAFDAVSEVAKERRDT